MRRIALSIAFFFCLGLFVNPAAAASLQQSLDWQKAWGAIDFSGANDPLIPATQHPAKNDIKSAVKACGDNLENLSGIDAFTLDFNNDGRTDIISDGAKYFETHASAACKINICTAADGCFISMYEVQEPTNLITGNDHSCPPPTQNTTCNSACPADINICPGNFKYNMKMVYTAQVKSWNFISAADFQALTTTGSYNLLNANPVLVAELNSTKCYLDELSLNNNTCVKYYQFDQGSESFIDLYVPPSTGVAEFDTRFTYTPFDRTHDHLARGMVMVGNSGGGGFGHRLPANGGTVDQQFASFDRNEDGHKAFMCYSAVNHSNNDYFVPTNTDHELDQFFDHLPPGVTVQACALRFTDWSGDTDCSAVNNPTGQTVTISAQRFCQRSSGAYASCQECIDAKVPGFEQGCNMVQQCPGTQCLIDSAPSWEQHNMDKFDGTYTTLAECYNKTEYWIDIHDWHVHMGDSSPSDLATTASWHTWCEAVFPQLCTYGHICLGPDTQISLPGGKTKRIDELKAGDLVLAYTKTKGALKPVKIKRLAVTKNQPLLNINDGLLHLTKQHRVVLESGLEVLAEQLKVGDKLLKDDGKVMVITHIQPALASTVYNLELEKGRGFIANGLRVSSYALTKAP